jgi:hypothetical protein
MIRKTEDQLGISNNNRVHIQFMNSYWGVGNPQEFVEKKDFLAFDDHRYVKWDPSVAVSKDNYLTSSCRDNRQAPGEGPTIVGEFSLSVPDNVEKSPEWAANDANKDFYRQWFAAQVTAYEAHTMGWVFWSWKASLGDYRWSYQDAVAAGVIPQNLDSIAGWGVCNGRR